MKRLKSGALFAAGLLWVSQAFAGDPFTVQVDLDNDDSVEVSLGLNNFEDTIDIARLRDQSGYDGSQAVSVDLFLRGIGANLTFATPGSGVLDFGMPGIDFNRGTDSIQFIPRNQGANVLDQREDSLDQLIDYLKKNKGALKAIFNAFARFSPIDPLAGNPDSLFGRKMKSDMDQGFTHKVSQVWGCGTSAFNMTNDRPILIASAGQLSDIFSEAQERAADLQAQNEVGVGLIYTSATADAPGGGSYKSTGMLIPISYTAKLDFNPSHKVRFDIPIGYTDTEGAKAVSLGVGLAYTFPVSEVWTLTPSYGLGATGSADLLSAGGVNSMAVTSAYTWRLGNWGLSMGNSIGKYSSMDLKIGDVEAGADISNTAISNGLILTGPNSLIAKNLVMEYSFMNTQIKGDEVYADQYNEFGVAIGRMGMDMGIIDNYLKFGVSYLMATGVGDINALKLNLAARF